MICDSCVNVIMRTFQNGGQDPYTVRVCSLDGAHMTYQLKECSRKEGKKVEEPAGYYKEILIAEQNAKDAMLPPLPEVAKKRGNPNWRKRGT